MAMSINQLTTLESIYLMPKNRFIAFITELTTKQLAILYLANHLGLKKRLELYLDANIKYQIKQKIQLINSMENKDEIVKSEIIIMDFELIMFR